ncbi:MAG: ABC transporter ATP-binding protein [Candidatus Saccharimonas sp.]
MPKKQRTRLIGLRAYLRFIRPHWPKLLLTLVLFTTASATLAAIPVVIGQLVQTLAHNPVDINHGWLLAWVLVFLSTGHDILWRASELTYRKLLTHLNYDYENVLFGAVIDKPYQFFVDKLTGKIGSYVVMITNEFRNLLAGIFFNFSGQLVTIIAILFILGTLNWQTGLIFLLGIIGMFIVGKYSLAYNMKMEARAADVASDKNGILYDAIANYASVKAFHTERQEYQTIEREQTKAFHANQKAFLSGIIFWTSMSVFVRHLIWPIIVLLNVWFFMHGQLSLGGLATLLSTVLMFSNTIWNGVWYVSQVGQQLARIDEAHLYLFGEMTDITSQLHKRVAAPTFSKQLAITKLNFAYPDKPDRSVLKDISLTIKHGEKIGIVGHSGSGKTTLTKLLLDFYQAPNGVITLDGQAISSEAFARLVSFVPQDTSLFHRSIADNIAYGTDKPCSLDDIKQAAQQACADDFIDTLPDGYDTLIGERGTKLSGGQRQRVAIARAIIQNRPILILDEATSALDSESEVKIQQALDTLWQGKTVIAVAHRLSTLRHMDRIVVMEHGKIIEDGSHSQLLEQNGIYAKLWNHQSGGFIEE